MARKSVGKSAPEDPGPPPNAVDGERTPVHTIHIGDVRASIWKEVPTEGSPPPANASLFTLTVDRQWREWPGGWRQSSAFRPTDLHHVAKAAAESLQWIEWQQRLADRSR